MADGSIRILEIVNIFGQNATSAFLAIVGPNRGQGVSDCWGGVISLSKRGASSLPTPSDPYNLFRAYNGPTSSVTDCCWQRVADQGTVAAYSAAGCCVGSAGTENEFAPRCSTRPRGGCVPAGGVEGPSRCASWGQWDTEYRIWRSVLVTKGAGQMVKGQTGSLKALPSWLCPSDQSCSGKCGQYAIRLWILFYQTNALLDQYWGSFFFRPVSVLFLFFKFDLLVWPGNCQPSRIESWRKQLRVLATHKTGNRLSERVISFSVYILNRRRGVLRWMWWCCASPARTLPSIVMLNPMYHTVVLSDPLWRHLDHNRILRT
jgi:hypothetical protein